MSGPSTALLAPAVADADFTLYVGDALDVLAQLPDESVHCVVTSPPYWNLRDYGVPPTSWPAVTYSPLVGFEVTVPPAACPLGLEETPEAFVGHLVLVMREVRRVLRADGTLWLNLGDTYASKQGGNPYSGFNSRWHGYPQGRGKQAAVGGAFPARSRHVDGLTHKDLAAIPWRAALALQADGWVLRTENIWDKANPMPESATDRPARSHEHLFLLAKASTYFYDYVAVRETASGTANARGSGVNPKATVHEDASAGVKQNADWSAAHAQLTARRNLRSVWRLASSPYPGAHFAVFPPALVRPCVLAGTSARGVCSVCGAPWLPVNEKRTLGRHELPRDHPEYRPQRYIGKHEDVNGGGQRYLDVVTVDWQVGCACDAATVPATVLDPFMGSGTTALVARELGRRSIGIDLNPEHAVARLAQQSLLAETS